MWDEEGSGSDLGSGTADFDVEERQVRRGETDTRQRGPSPACSAVGGLRYEIRGSELEEDDPANWRGDSKAVVPAVASPQVVGATQGWEEDAEHQLPRF
jgi:hypothetical protein